MPFSYFANSDQPGLVEERLAVSLFDPIHEFLDRPRYSLRSQTVQMIYELAGGETPSVPVQEGISRCARAIEALLAGVVIFDDIEDNARERRGQQALHIRIGTPLALNAGFWLCSFANRLLMESDAPEFMRAIFLEDLNRSMLSIAQGRALNLSVTMGDTLLSEVPTLCRQSMEWKYGAVFELAASFGARWAGVEGRKLRALKTLGRDLGVSFQMFEDLQELHTNPLKPGAWDTLMEERPSFIWWIVAEEFPDDWKEFVQAVRDLPRVQVLERLLTRDLLRNKAQERAKAYQKAALQRFIAEFGETPGIPLRKLEELASDIAQIAD